MERWEVLIDSYTPTPSLRDFIKAIQTAGVVLKESLAPFEIAWILQTLLHKPVNLIATVKGTNNDVVWYKTIGDAFKLLGEVTATHTEALEEHFRDIVDLCLLDLDPKVRHHALSCLAAVARASPLGAEHPERHLACLEAVPTCRAPVALLVGTICECHPAEVANDINKIWRIYLNLLDSHKNTERITTCLLQGILGIFKNFGVDLPTIELTTFYDNLANDYIRRSQCQSVCLQILSNHSDLFKERLSKDISLRTYLWNTLYESEGSKTRDIVKAIYSLYVAICDVLDKGQMQQIATSELLSLAASHRTQVKYASLRIMSHVNSTHGTAVDVAGKTDVQALESELREGTVSYEVAEAVSWCIEANLPNSDKLLQSAVLFYANLPSSRRKEIVVYGILNAPSELRSATITFLISETIESFETHLTLWKDLFDTDKGTDNTVIEKSKLVFEDFMRYLIFVFNEFLEENVETAPEKLLTLLHLTSEILTYQPPECYTNVYCNVVLPLIIRLVRKYPHEATVRVARTLHLHLEDSLASLQELYEIIQVDRCKDEALLCESCLLLIEAADDKVDVANVVTALEIIFSRNDVEPSTLSKALKKLEHTINTGSDSISSSMIHRVEKLRARNDLKGKDARILHRDVIMFLGKYGGKADINDNECIENLNLVKLMETFTLTIQNPEEGSKYKVNLQRILQLALEHEDPNALQTLLTIICANLSTKPDPVLQQILPRVCLALSRAFARGGAADPRGVRAGVALCDGDAGRRVADYISTEKSPGVRRMLSDALETQLRAEGGALGAAVAEQVMGLLKSDVSTTRRAGLDLTETLIAAFDKNHRLSEIFLPDLILLIPKTREPNCENTFEVATAQFMEKIELFDGDIVENLVKDLLRFLLHKQNGGEIKMADVEANVYKKTVTKVLGFAEKVCVYKNHDKFTIIETIFEIFSDDCVFVNLMYVLAAIRKVFDYDTDLCRLVLSYNECFVLNQLFCMGVCQDYFSTEAVLVFLQEYADISLELQYENTLAFVAKIIENLYPDHVKYLHKTVKSCLSAFVKNRTPAILITAIENWCNKMALQDITRSIEKELFTEKHAEIVFTINTLIDAIHLSDMSTLTEIQNASKEWTMTLLKLFSRDYITEYLQSKMAYLTDLLSVSVKFLTLTDIKKIATEGCAVEGVSTESIGVKFCRYFIPVFYQIFLRKPYVLLEKELSRCSLLLNDIVKFTVKKKCDEEQIDSVLELVDKLWPTYSSYATLHQKQSLLQDMMNLPKKLDPESNPLLWAVSVISSDARREEKARIIGVLPRGDAYSQAYRTFAATLPTRLSDLDQESSASFRALLDALAMTKDRVLLDIITTLASGDDATGWWDSALESLAFDMDMALYNAVYTHCWEGMSLGVCRRVMLPLLRHSTPSFCEEFFSTILPDLLNVKEVKTASSQYKYHKYIVDYTRVFMLLQVAFEKIPLQSLESPNSLLYTKLKPTQLWHLIRVTCNLCISLRTKKTLPEGASAALKEDYRLFQCANYNCLSAAICRRKPEDHKFYNVLFDPAIWNKLVDDSKEYKIYIQPQWVNISQAQNRRTRRQAVSIHVESSSSTLRSTPRTLRTRMFLRTLSENPAQYDLTEIEEEEIEIQEIVLEESELNRHECAGAMTALLRHMPSLQSLSQALSKTMSAGVQWLVAQVIINCKEELKPQASDLRPALLDIIASTAIERNGKKVLNGLHVNILETLIHWSDDDPHSSPSLDATIELLLATCIEHRIHSSLFYTLLDVLSKFLEIYGPVATVKWSVFEGYQNDPAALKTFEILKRVAKAKIYIAELLPALLDRMESKQAIQTPKLAELFGLALVTCPEKEQYFNRFKKILDKLRSINGAEYVKVLFYAQIGCHKCCDEYNFRKIIDITTKMVGAEQTKCFRILATFIENSPQNDYVTELYDTIDLGEFVIEESVEAMAVVKVGMKHIRDNTKRRLVTQIAGYCTHSLVKVRTAACEVVLAAFDDLFSKNEAMPPPKRAKITTTVMIGAILDKDVYSSAILNAISCGVTDGDSGIQSMVRGRMGDRLSKNMGSRFTEAFLFTVYLPCTTNNNQDMSVCVSALLELLFSHLKRQQRFRELKLKDEPLEIRETSSGPSKLLTMSRTYQGTFRGSMALTSGRKARQIQATNETPDIDVQISIDKILDTFLQFSKETSETASAFCLEFVKSLIANQFEQGNTIATCLKTILDKPSNELTPFVVDLCHVFINEVSKIEGFLKTAENLKLATKNTEGDQITKQLYQDVKLRSTGFDQFVLGTKLKDEEDQDVVMDDESQFSVEDLTSAFGKLSNWDTLTSQEKRKIMASGLPPLWTDKENFKQLIEDFSAPNNWFGRMLSAYRQEDKEYTMKWMREIDKWPRRHFAVSAITEAIEWQTSQDAELRSMCDIQPSDCLAEWAGRLMISSLSKSLCNMTAVEHLSAAQCQIELRRVTLVFNYAEFLDRVNQNSCQQRTAYINALNAESEPTQREVMLPRLHELAWCERANERWLSKFVLDCVSRNTDQELFNQEMLPWLLQKLLVLRDEGLSTGSGALSRALAAAEAYTPQFIKQTEDSVVWRMYHLILMLNRDLDSLSKEKIQDILQQTNERIKENHDSISDSKHSLYPIYELAAGYYDDLWNEAADSEERNNILSDLLDVLGSTIDLGINNEGLLALVLNKLDDFNLDLRPDLAKMILDKIQLQIETIDDFSLNQLQKHANLFPSRLLNDYPFMRERDGDLLTKYKRCFQLICDAEYSLMQYCILLKKALENNDQHEWEVVFSRMKSKMFDNPYAGSDFQMLTKFKNKLYEICEYDSTPTFKTSADKTLKDIIRQLRVRPPQSTLRLSQLCPALGGGAGGCAAALLGLRGGGAVLRIEEAVQIYTASERRPALITVLLSNGTKKRYLHKSGEPLKVDAAAQNVMRFMQTLWKRERGYKDGVIGYNVTPLSEDCGLIEFLEDHIELRKLIASTSNIDVLDSVNRPMDHELILSPSQTALTLHSQMCSKIPSFCLRSAIHKRCVSERDRTFKMAKFMHSVCAASVVTWILGLGDRHLENILYSIQDGGVCHVDWAAVFRRGVMELPPARLTRNIVAVCDELELEAALQQLLTTLRRSHTLLGALIRMSFNWMGDQFQLKYPQIESLLQGATQSHQVTRQTIEDSSLGDLEKTKYLELLDGVFEGFQVKESYSVEEQISSFLRHCTDPRILSVTRSGWEPWI